MPFVSVSFSVLLNAVFFERFILTFTIYYGSSIFLRLDRRKWVLRRSGHRMVALFRAEWYKTTLLPVPPEANVTTPLQARMASRFITNVTFRECAD